MTHVCDWRCRVFRFVCRAILVLFALVVFAILAPREWRPKWLPNMADCPCPRCTYRRGL